MPNSQFFFVFAFFAWCSVHRGIGRLWPHDLSTQWGKDNSVWIYDRMCVGKWKLFFYDNISMRRCDEIFIIIKKGTSHKLGWVWGCERDNKESFLFPYSVFVCLKSSFGIITCVFVLYSKLTENCLQLILGTEGYTWQAECLNIDIATCIFFLHCKKIVAIAINFILSVCGSLLTRVPKV